MDLEYSDAYNLHCEIRLKSGRIITLEALDQYMTYALLLEGAPNAKINDMLIHQALGAAERFCVRGARPHLIVPPRRSYRRQPGDMDKVPHSPHYVREWLPEVRCIGSFKSIPPARNQDRMLSVSVVVWFQDEYAMPIREPTLSQLLELDWDALATDVDL